MKVFVTGGAGLLGGSIIQELNKQNHHISVLVRSKNKNQSLFDPKVELVEGDLLNIEGFKSTLMGQDILIHSAACYSEYYRGSDKNLPYVVNVNGTLSLFEAAYNQGIRNAVYIIIPGLMKYVDVRDVAKAVVESITKGKGGECYLIGGRQYPISQIFKTLGEISGRPSPSKRISPKKIILVARVMQLISKITGRPPALKVAVVKRL